VQIIFTLTYYTPANLEPVPQTEARSQKPDARRQKPEANRLKPSLTNFKSPPPLIILPRLFDFTINLPTFDIHPGAVMSKFKILRIDHFDPAAVGKKNRRIFIIYSIIPTAIIILFNIYSNHDNKSSIILYIILPVATAIYLFLIWKLRRTTKQIKTIGDIEFTTSGIKKRIGDSYVEYNYQMVKGIEVQKHIPATSVRESKSGYFSYILKIIFLVSGSETIVISDRSIDSKQKLSIIDTMKALKRIVGFEIRLP
jgi:hypothetical protein